MKFLYILIIWFFIGIQAFSTNINIRVTIHVKHKKIAKEKMYVVIEGLDLKWNVDTTIKGSFNKSDSSYSFCIDKELLNSKANLCVVYDSIEFGWHLDGLVRMPDTLLLREMNVDILSVEDSRSKLGQLGRLWFCYYEIGVEDNFKHLYEDPIPVSVAVGTCSPLSFHRFKEGPGKDWESIPK